MGPWYSELQLLPSRKEIGNAMSSRKRMQRPDFGQVVAEEQFLFVGADGSEKTVTARLGAPYHDTERESASGTVWACPCEVRGFELRYPDIRGEGSWQALCLAITFVRARLDDFCEKGGRILDPRDRHEVSLSVLFGRRWD